MSQTEVIVIVCVIVGVLVIGCVGLSILGLLLPSLAKARSEATRLKDATQIRQIHQSWVIWANEWEGGFPTPGLINRLPFEGEEVPGRGPEDVLANDHAALYSACIMANLFTPALCVGPTEPNANVYIKDDYNWDLYSPMDDSFWDPSFQVKLDSISNASYAALALTGERKASHWRETMDRGFAVLGNRGVKNGVEKGSDYDRSLTLLIHGSRRNWLGNVCYNDNHVDLQDTFTPLGLTYLDEAEKERPDNLFRNDTGGIDNSAGYDIWLTLIDRLSGDPESPMVSAQWD